MRLVAASWFSEVNKSLSSWFNYRIQSKFCLLLKLTLIAFFTPGACSDCASRIHFNLCRFQLDALSLSL